MFSLALGENLREESLSPGYFFYGEETYLADQFVLDLRALLIPQDSGDFRPDLFHLDETRWPEIIDAARSMPFLFSPWRIVVVRVPEKDSDADKSGEKEAKLVSAAEAELLKSYFASPSQRSLLVVVLPGKISKIRKSHPLVRVFSSLPGVTMRELKALKPDNILQFMAKTASSAGKVLTQDAARRLLEIVGCDLRLMDNEIKKLALYVEDKKAIGLADVDQAAAWVRGFDSYEFDDALGKANIRDCLIALDSLFKSGHRPPEQVLYKLVCFFRDALVAGTMLREKGNDKDKVFKRLFPNLKPNWSLTQEKWTRFFSLVESLSRKELVGLLEDLERIDILIKSSSAEAQRLFEVFLYKYCQLRKKERVSSRVSGLS